jgi:hypothetical protein
MDAGTYNAFAEDAQRRGRPTRIPTDKSLTPRDNDCLDVRLAAKRKFCAFGAKIGPTGSNFLHLGRFWSQIAIESRSHPDIQIEQNAGDPS